MGHKVKCCPFCGSWPVLKKTIDGSTFWVECPQRSCGATGPQVESGVPRKGEKSLKPALDRAKEKCVQKWNDRGGGSKTVTKTRFVMGKELSY